MKEEVTWDDIPSFLKNNFPVKIQEEECEIFFFSYICCQSRLKIQMNCIFFDWFCFHMNSKIFHSFPPPLASPQKQDSASQSKQTLLSRALGPFKAHSIQEEIRSLGKIGEEKKGSCENI